MHDPFPTQPPQQPNPRPPPVNSPPSSTTPPLQNNQHPPPNFDHYNMKIMQWNCNGIGNKLHDLTQFVHENNIKIIALQETKLNAKSKPPTIPNFTLIRQDRERDMGGGLAYYVHSSINFTPGPQPQNDNVTEVQSFKVGNLNITNLYIPPVTSCPNNYIPTLTPYLQGRDSLVLGDINAHDHLWNSNIQDNRGSIFADEISQSNIGVLNEEQPTRLPTYGQPTSPDISLASLSLLPNTKWEVKKNLGSDHLPIIITISTSLKQSKSIKRTYVNFKKADWDKFTSMSEEKFSNAPAPTNIFEAEKTFRRIINKTAKKFIPAGRIKDTIPEIPTSAMDKINKRDELRDSNPTSPEINNLNYEINSEINNFRKEKWKETVNNIKGNSSKLFKLIKNLSNKDLANPNQAIRFKGKYLSLGRDIATGFVKQFTSIVHHKSSKSSRKVTKDIKKNNLDESVSFTTEQTKEAIKRCKASKAAGPDGMSNLHLKHLGPKGIEYLTQIFNLSVQNSAIPDIWKQSFVIPLLKPGKDKGDSNSYRPVSLLCPAIKILERLILPSLQENLPIPDFQHGFRQLHSTVTALNEFNIQVSEGFSKTRPPDRTILLQLDLSKAFDMVNLDKLLQELNQSTLPPPLKRWFCCYLKGRQAQVHFRNSTSRFKNVRTGVPQGAVTSPVLFNFYLSKLPKPPTGVYVVQYADDISIYTSGNNIKEMTEKINSYAKDVAEYLEERKLILSAEKSTVTLFTPDTKEYNIHPQVIIDNTIVPLEKNPKLLGVVFDTMHTFTPHINNTITKAKSKINLMKTVAGNTWGQSKEMLSITYKALARSTLEYAIPVWSPIISSTCWTKLQTVQNQALRVITGCLQMTPIVHLHRETKILPLKEHGEMLTKQFFLNCHLPGHPSYKHLNRQAPGRPNRKPTILRLKLSIEHLLPVPDKPSLKQSINRIHTETVQSTINQYENNKVLNDIPPEISSEEVNLSRKERCLLSQLRSGYSSLLYSYKHRIDTTDTIQDMCPKCGISPHDTPHLFTCIQNPTNLTPISLWTTPHQAANFLKLDEGIT